MPRETGIVEFEADFLPYFRNAFGTFFPEDKFPDGFLEGVFNSVAYGKLIDNSKCSIVPFGPSESPKDGQRLYLYGLAVAHICYLQGRGVGLVGAISSGTQGSVSAGANTLNWANAGGQYWGQSQFGAQFWMMTAYLRSFRYFPGLPGSWK